MVSEIVVVLTVELQNTSMNPISQALGPHHSETKKVT